MSTNGRMSWSMRRALDDFKRGPGTLFVWLAAICAAGFLFHHRSQRFEYIGLARGIEYQVASEQGGRIESLLVDLCEDVRADDVLVKLDDTLLKAQIETARASVLQLEAQLEATQLNLATNANSLLTDWQSKLAEFTTREEKYRIDALNLKVAIESDRVEQQRLRLEMERMRKLLEAQAAPQRDYDMIQLQHDQVAIRIAENTSLVAIIEKDMREARARREEFARRLPAEHPTDDMIAPLRAAIRKEELEMEELRIQRGRMVLRAAVSGRVSQVLCHPGQVVSASEPILCITEKHASQVIGYIAEYDTAPVQETMRVQIARADQPRVLAEASILRLGIGIEELPARLWRDPRRPEYGRSFVVTSPLPLAIAPSEKIVIRFVSPRDPVTAPFSPGLTRQEKPIPSKEDTGNEPL